MMCVCVWGDRQKKKGRRNQGQSISACTGQGTPGAAPGLNSAVPSRKALPWGETGPIWPPTRNLENDFPGAGPSTLYPEAVAKPMVMLWYTR